MCFLKVKKFRMQMKRIDWRPQQLLHSGNEIKFGDEPFQAINCTRTNDQTHKNQQKCTD